MKKNILFVSLIWTSMSSALTLPEFLQTVEVTNQTIMSAKAQKDSAKSKRISSDLDLSPLLTFDYGYLNDEKPGFLPTLRTSKTEASTYTLGVAQKISTGTTFQVALNGVDTHVEGSSYATPPAAVENDSATGALSFAVSQSLWKNGFGKDVSLRQEREESLAKINDLAAEMEIRSTLINAEKVYWNYLVLKEEIKVRESSIERAQKLVNWMSKRAHDGISETSDLSQMQTLLELRKLDLITAQDELKAVEQSIAEMISLPEGKAIPPIQGDISSLRSIPKIISDETEGKVHVIRLDAKISELESKMKKTISEEVENSLKPDLTVSAKYSTNSQEDELNQAVSKSTETNTPTYSVGVHFAWIFDGDAKRGLKNSAIQDKNSAELVWRQKQIQSANSWNELVRRHGELTKKITSVQKISELRKSISKSEESKLSRGRTITSNVIDSVQNAEESELSLLKLKSEQRKLEADSKLFIVNQ